MNISGFDFRPVTGNSLYGGPGVFIYQHQASGKCFVRAMRNSKVQRGKNNYPKYLKELLKVSSSDVVLLFSEIKTDTKEAVWDASRTVITKLTEMGKLFKRAKPNRSLLGGVTGPRYTVWSMMHKYTGAIYYFEEVVDAVDVKERIAQRIRTFNSYVIHGIAHTNRVLYYFAKQQFPLLLDDWVIRDLEANLESEHKAILLIAKLSKGHLENDEVVLNRVCNTDSLYYRNAMLKLRHVSLEQYLQRLPA